MPSAKNFGTAATYAPFGVNSGEIAQDALLPASAYSYQVNDSLWVGLSVSTPYGLETRNPVLSAISPFAIHSKIVTYNINPMVAWKVNDMLTLGLGLQLQYGKSLLTFGIPSALTPTSAVGTIKGEGWAGGITAGATITPWAGTEIGLGFRSSVKTDLDGSFRIPGLVNLPTTLSADTADIYTIGLRQRITPQFDLLAGFEYDHWKLGTIPVINTLTNTQVFLSPTAPVAVPFNYKNGWTASIGGEYRLNDAFTLRSGIAYEKAPIDNTNRRPSLPERDRIWTGVGLKYTYNATNAFDVGYSHIFGRGDSTVSVSNGPIFYQGTAKGHVDIFSVSWNHRFDTPAVAPLRAKY
jgi:long-chain fatty acid transport protein